MTRIIGSLGSDKTGYFIFKPSAVFAGASREPVRSRVVDGVVDVVLPANPAGTCWLVAWREQFDGKPPEFTEKWIVPWEEEVNLDEIRAGASYRRSPRGRSAALDNTISKNEVHEAQRKVFELEEQNAKLLSKLVKAEGNAAHAVGNLASYKSEVGRLQQRLNAAAEPIVQTTTQVVEKKILPADARQMMADARAEIVFLQQENEELKQQLEDRISLSTHFTNLNSEIDRLNSEKLQLLVRIDELKQPRRHASSLRKEMIANLDRLLDG
jgi:hypothetical protein